MLQLATVKDIKTSQAMENIESQRRIVRCWNEASYLNQIHRKHKSCQEITIKMLNRYTPAFLQLLIKKYREKPPSLISKQAELHNWYAA